MLLSNNSACTTSVVPTINMGMQTLLPDIPEYLIILAERQ
jgi:hypothetical protein